MNLDDVRQTVKRVAAVALVAVAAAGSAVAASRHESAPTPQDTVRGFLVAAVVDQDTVTACKYHVQRQGGDRRARLVRRRHRRATAAGVGRRPARGPTKASRGCARIAGMVPSRRYVALLLVLVVVGWIAALVSGGSGAAVGPVAGSPTPTQTPTPAPAGVARDVTAALDRVQRAFDAGDVSLLCRPGALVDPAVIRQQDAQSGGCAAEAEALSGDEPKMQLDVRSVAADGDLATATVKTARGTTARVDLIHTSGRWLLSFSDADDPLPGLAGVS